MFCLIFYLFYFKKESKFDLCSSIVASSQNNLILFKEIK
jgi:hypothetical protein